MSDDTFSPVAPTTNIIPVSISKHMPSKVWDEITYLFPNFNVEIWECDK